MKKIFLTATIAMSMFGLVSCNSSSAPSQNDVDSLSTNLVEDSLMVDSIPTRGGLEVFGEESPSGTEVQSEGFGRCLESGCYCKEFKGRGQTCRNCGHAYRRHY